MTASGIVGIALAGGLGVLCTAIAIATVLLVISSIKDDRR